jgi:hypothetical protein
LAAYTTIFATECSKKDDLQISYLGHLIKSLDWFNGYNEERISVRFLKAQPDSLNISILNLASIGNKTEQITKNYNSYKSHINLLDADEKINGSLLDLKYNTETENKKFFQSLVNISDISKFIIIYKHITILLVIGVRLGACQKLHGINCWDILDSCWRYWNSFINTDNI